MKTSLGGECGVFYGIGVRLAVKYNEMQMAERGDNAIGPSTFIITVARQGMVCNLVGVVCLVGVVVNCQVYP